MDINKTGGPAHPTLSGGMVDDKTFRFEGMTLWDWYVGQYIAGGSTTELAITRANHLLKTRKEYFESKGGCMSIEAMKQALETFKMLNLTQVIEVQWTINALRQAIEEAEKQFNPDWDQQAVLVKRIRELEAQQALDKKADNARELGLDYEPTHTDHPMRHWDRTCPACVEQAEKQEPDAEYEGEDVLATWCADAIRARGEK